MKNNFIGIIFVLNFFAFTLNAQTAEINKNIKSDRVVFSSKEAAQIAQIKLEKRDPVISKLYETGGPYEQFKNKIELPTERTLSSRTYKNDDGSFTALMTAGNMHYEEDGVMKTSSNEIIPNISGHYNTYPLANLHNRVKTYYGKPADGVLLTSPDFNNIGAYKNVKLSTIDATGVVLNSFEPANVTPVKGSQFANKNFATYSNIFSGVDMVIYQETDKLQSEYTITDRATVEALAPGATNIAITENIELPVGYKAIITSDIFGFTEGFRIENAEGVEIAKYYHFKYYEKNNPFDAASNTAKFKATQTGNAVQIVLEVPVAWLLEQNRVYPIVIDPTLTVTPNAAQWWTGVVDEDSDDLNYGGATGDDIAVGFEDGSTGNDQLHGYAKFNTSSINDDATISSTSFQMYYYSWTNGSGNNGCDWRLTRMYQQPDCCGASASSKYNSIQNGNCGEWYGRWDAWGTPGSNCSNCGNGNCYDFNEGATNAWYNFPVNSIINSAIQGALTSDWFGLGMDQLNGDFDCGWCFSDEDNWEQFEGQSNSARPQLIVTFTRPYDILSTAYNFGSIGGGASVSHSWNSTNYNNDYAGRSTADVYYRFTLTSTQSVTIGTCSSTSGFDTYINLLNSSGGLITANDDACAPYSSITTTLCPGTYYVVVEGWTTTGAYNLVVSTTNWAVLSASAGSASYCSLGSVTIGGSPSASGGNSASYTYSWSPTTSLNNSAIANPVSSPSAGSIAYTLTVGDGCTSATSTTTVTNNSNNACASAISTTTGGSYAYDTRCATFDGPSMSCAGATNPLNLWYSYTPPSSGTLTVANCGSTFDTKINIFSNNCSGTDVGCNDDFCGNSSTVSITVCAGVTYYISVGGYSASGIGSGTLTVNFAASSALAAGSFTSNTQTICASGDPTNIGATSNVAASGGTGTLVYSWEYQDNGTGGWTPIGSTNTTTYDPPSGLSGVTSRTYRRRVTDVCGATAVTTNTGTVTLQTAPVATAGANQTICSTGGTISGFSATNASNITWTTTGTGTFSPASGTTNPTYTPSAADITAGSVNITMTAVATSPCAANSTTAARTITIQTAPVATAGANQTICGTGGTISGFSATNASNITWTTTGTGTFSPASGTTNPTYTPSAADITAGSVNITMTAVATSPCAANSTTAARTITIQKVPVAAAGANQTICSTGGTISGFSATNASNITWTTTGTGTFSPASGTTNPTYTPSAADITAGSVNITMTAVATSPCAANSTTAARTITIQTAPVATAGANQTICGTGGTISGFSATNASNITWTTTGTGTFSPASGTTNPTYTPSAADITAGSVNITMTAVATSPCAANSTTAARTITIQKVPVAAAGANQTICSTGGTISGFSATNASNITWTTTGTGTFSPASGTTNPTYTPSAADITAGSVNITMTAVATSPCAANSTTAARTITIQTAPVATAGANQTICGTGGTISGFSATNASNITWTTTGTGTFSPASGTTNPTYTPSAADITAGSVNITMTAVATSPCAANSTTAARTITIQKVPVAAAGANQTICSTGGTISGFSATNASNITWTTTGTGTFSPASGTTNPTYTPSAADITAGSVNITMTAVATSPCAANSTTGAVTITVRQTPTASVTVTGTSPICETASSTVRFSGLNGTTVTYNINGGSSTTSAITSGGFVDVGTGSISTSYTYNVVDVYYTDNSPSCVATPTSSATVTVVTGPIQRTVTAPTNVCTNLSGTVKLIASESGTVYQLYNVTDATNVGSTQTGNGSDLNFSTGALTSTKTFRIVASRSPCISLDMNSGVDLDVYVIPSNSWNGSVDSDWFKPANWCYSPAGIPTLALDATIPTGLSTDNDPIVSASGAVCRSLFINSGGALEIGGSQNLEVWGTWDNSGTVIYNTSTVTFKGTTGISITGATDPQEFYNLTVDKGTNTTPTVDIQNNTIVHGVLSPTNGLIKVPADLVLSGGTTIASTAGIEVTGGNLRSDGLNIANNGLYKVTTGTDSLNNLTNGSGSTYSHAGGTSVLTGNVANTGTTVTTAGGLVNVGGDWSNASSSTVTYSGATVAITGDYTSSASVVNANSATVSIGGDYTNSSSSTLSVGGAIVTVGGSLVSNNSSVNQTSGSVKFNSNGGSYNSNAIMDINAGSNMAISGGTIVFENANGGTGNDLVIAAGGTKTITGGTFQFGNSNTPASQVFKVNNSDVDFNNLNVDNSSGNNPKVQLVANAATRSAGVLTIDGILDLNGYIFNVKNSATSGIVAGNNGYVLSETAGGASKLVWNIGNNTGAYVFPFGNAAGDYIPFTFNVTSAGTQSGTGNIALSTYPTADNNTPWVTSVQHMNFDQGPGDGTDATLDRWWIIDANNYATRPTSNMTFAYSTSDLSGNSLITESNLKAQRWNATGGPDSLGGWDLPTEYGITNTVNTGNHTVTASGVSRYSPWVLHDGDTPGNSPLPIELVDFKASCTDDVVTINWTTATEVNNDYFTVQRSTNLTTFDNVGVVDGAGNSNAYRNYSIKDQYPLSGTSYYRLMQTDFNGEYEVFSPVAVACVIKGSDVISVFPNPAQDRLNVSMNLSTGDRGRIMIYNHYGQLVESMFVEPKAGVNTYNFDLGNLAQGQYFVSFSMENKVLPPQKVIITR